MEQQIEQQEGKSRKASDPVTDSEAAAIITALIATDGSVLDAEQLCGVPAGRIRRFIDRNPDLSVRFPSARTPVEDLVPADPNPMTREPLLGPEERRQIDAAIKEEKALRREDFDRLGLERAHVDQLVGLEKFAGISLAQSIRVAHGGQNKVMLGLLGMFDKFSKRLDEGTWPYTLNAEGDQVLDEAKGVNTLVGISSEIRAVYAQLNKTQALMIRAQELAKRAKERGKPGYSTTPPPQVAVQVNGGVVHVAADGKPNER